MAGPDNEQSRRPALDLDKEGHTASFTLVSEHLRLAADQALASLGQRLRLQLTQAQVAHRLPVQPDQSPPAPGLLINALRFDYRNQRHGTVGFKGGDQFLQKLLFVAHLTL